MSTVYVTSDPHFGHRKLAEVRGFSCHWAQDAWLATQWNAVVRKRDVVYVLGDLFDQSVMSGLKGTKKLALGNHDKRPVSVYAEHFSKVAAYYEFDGCLLSHIPVHPEQLGRWDLNVHGHTHAREMADRRYVNACVEMHEFRPVPLRELIEGRRRELKR